MMKQLHVSTRILIGEIAFLVAAASVLSILHYPRLLPLNINLFLHILGAVMFIGNIVVTAVWMVWAERTKDEKIITFAVRMVNWMDVFFTGPGVILLLLNGLLMVPYCEECTQGFATHWIAVSLGLFGVTGALWATLLVYQNTLVKGLAGSSEQFYRTLHRWYVVGTLNTIIPLVILAVMTTKPGF